MVSSGTMAFGARDKERTPHSFWEINVANGIMATVAITFQLIQLLKGESPGSVSQSPKWLASHSPRGWGSWSLSPGF